MMLKSISVIILSALVSIGLNGQEVVDYVLKVRALRESGNNKLAVSEAENAIKMYRDSRIYIEAAEAAVALNDNSAAINYFNEADKLAPGSGEYGLARIYAIKGDAATSLYHLALSMESAYKKNEKEILLDNSFRRIENSPEWRQFWKKDWYSETEESISQIEFYNSRGVIGESEQLVAGLRDKYGDSKDVLYAEALVAMASGKYALTIKNTSILVREDPENKKYLELLAQAQFASSNPAGASTTYTQLINSGIDDAGLYLKRAECYRKTGENTRALADIEKYMGYYPESMEALRLAGKTESVSGDNLKALEYFSRNIKLHPSNAQVYVDRADSYFISKSWTLAADDYSMSLDLNPSNAEVYLNKGIALLNVGRRDDACIDFRRALDLGNKKASDYIGRNCLK